MAEHDATQRVQPRRQRAREARRDARVRRAVQVVGIVAGGVFSWVVISRGTLDDYDRCKGQEKGAGSRVLKAALLRLADHYALGDVQPPPDWE